MHKLKTKFKHEMIITINYKYNLKVIKSILLAVRMLTAQASHERSSPASVAPPGNQTSSSHSVPQPAENDKLIMRCINYALIMDEKLKKNIIVTISIKTLQVRQIS